MVNIASMLDRDGNPYHCAILDDTDLNAVSLSNLSTHYLQGGSDGDTSDEAFEEVAAEKMTKEEALKFKHKIDNRSLILADGGGKLQRLHDVLVSTIRIMKNLNQQYLERIVYLEKLVKVRNDYKEFSLEEKDNLNFCVVLGHALRQVARTDMVLKNGDVSVINNAEIYAVYDEIHDLLPAEEPLNY